MNEFFLAKGLGKWLDTKTGKFFGDFNLNRWFRETAKRYGIAFTDPCCPEASDRIPVSYNATTGQVEYLNSGAWTGASPLLVKRTASAINATATATSTQVKSGLITSTSAAATSITLPSATAMATALGAIRGTSFEFVVDNSTGANTVTLVAGTGTTVQSSVTGGDDLTVESGVVGVYRYYFKSGTTNTLARIS